MDNKDNKDKVKEVLILKGNLLCFKIDKANFKELVKDIHLLAKN